MYKLLYYSSFGGCSFIYQVDTLMILNASGLNEGSLAEGRDLRIVRDSDEVKETMSQKIAEWLDANHERSSLSSSLDLMDMITDDVKQYLQKNDSSTYFYDKKSGKKRTEYI